MPPSPASPISAKEATLRAEGELAALLHVRTLIVGSARGFQSYPVAREAMNRLAISIDKRIFELKALLGTTNEPPKP